MMILPTEYFELILDRYIDAMYWKANLEDEREEGLTIDSETMAQVVADCADFYVHICRYIDTDKDLERAGMDFWLTRNGHGSGFWNGEWNNYPDHIVNLMTEYAESKGPFHFNITMLEKES